MATLTEQLDNLYVTTWQSMQSKVVDQIFDATPWFFWLKSKGKMRSHPGGRWIEEPLQYAKYDATSWVTKGQAVDLNDYEILQAAKAAWEAHEIGASELRAVVRRFKSQERKRRIQGRWHPGGLL